MDLEKTGRLIAELRKARQMTQKELAARLHVTDKAVSKWERGLSYPDVSLLLSLADILGVTPGELLRGEANSPGGADTDAGVHNALIYADSAAKRRSQSLQAIFAAAFSLLLLVGIVVCVICDMALSGSLTWSLFPISSIIFAWFVLFPIVRRGANGVTAALVWLSTLILPFLYTLSRLLPGQPLVFPIGARMALIALPFLWAFFALFKRLRGRRHLAAALTALLVIPLSLLVNLCLSSMIGEPFFDGWDFLTCLSAAATAWAFFSLDRAASRRQN